MAGNILYAYGEENYTVLARQHERKIQHDAVGLMYEDRSKVVTPLDHTYEVESCGTDQ
jgi:hypothetical protein